MEDGSDRTSGATGEGGTDRLWATLRRLFGRSPALPTTIGSRRAKVAAIESFEYYPGDSKVYREWLSRQPIFRNYDRWLMMLFIGIAVGLMGRVLYTLMHALSDFKYATLRHLLSQRQLFLAWLFSTVYGGALAFAAAYPVAYIAPAAAGSAVAPSLTSLPAGRCCSCRTIPRIRSTSDKSLQIFPLSFMEEALRPWSGSTV